MQILSRPKEREGIGLPDFLKYYRAMHLTRIVDCHCNKDYKQWVGMEFEDASIPLLTSPWLTAPTPKDLRDHPLIGATLTVARTIFCNTGISPLPSP